MKDRIIWIALITGFLFLTGCNQTEYRMHRFQSQYPGWNEETTRKVAKRKVEIGMNREMVVAAMGEPDEVFRDGDQLKMTYSKLVQNGEYFRKKPVYWVYIKGNAVVRIEGDPRELGYTYWSK
jgi:hypothetical protein